MGRSKRPEAPERVFLVCSGCSTSGSVWLDDEEAFEEAKMLTQSEGVKWGVFPFTRDCSLPILRLK
jgi:hypothetical protein